MIHTITTTWNVKKTHKCEPKQTTLEYLIEHLKRYGNTILKENPSKYEEDLKSVGIKIKYKLEEGKKSGVTEYKIPNYYLIWRTKR